MDDIAGSAWLFDVDGTLVDSNYLHVAAWLHAFDAVHRLVPAWRIHRDIGMDSGKLLADLLGDDADSLGPDAKAAHKDAHTATAHLLKPLPGSRELLRYLARHGAAVVLATSAPPEELSLLRQVLDVDDILTAVTNADDVDTAKPDPGIVEIAINRSGRPASRSVFVGDAVWDMQAAQTVGIRRIAVLSGGISAGELRSAGADDVFDGPADVLASLIDAAASPRAAAEQGLV
jgi:HAD superfamily hydrolase (TIGR01509 family)